MSIDHIIEAIKGLDADTGSHKEPWFVSDGDRIVYGKYELDVARFIKDAWNTYTEIRENADLLCLLFNERTTILEIFRQRNALLAAVKEINDVGYPVPELDTLIRDCEGQDQIKQSKTF